MMKGWTRSTLGELCKTHGGKIQTGPFGSQLHQSDYVEDGIPVVMPKDINQQGIALDSIARVDSPTADRLARHKLHVDEIVFPRRGEITKCALIRLHEEGFLCGTGCLKITIPKKALNPRFFRYYLAKQEIIEWLDGNAVGATMKNLSTGILEKLPVVFPPLPIQQKIAGILAAYDDLIENNLKRIRLLEEMAQLTYEEWFVRLRFPGHESTSTNPETSLPEGWSLTVLSELISIKHGYAFKGEYFTEEETTNILLTPGNFKIGGGLKLDKVKYYADAGPITQEYVLARFDLLVTMTDLSKDGDTLGYPLLVPTNTKKKFLHNQRLGKVIPKDGKFFPRFFLYQLFRDERYRGYVLGSASGATVKHTSPSKILSFKIIIPNQESKLAEKFEGELRPIFDQIDNWLEQNQRLREARDILLPRLMTGVIDVESYDPAQLLKEAA